MTQKSQLDVAFYHAWDWLNNGLGVYNGTALADPPNNKFLSQGEEYGAKTILDRDDAWGIYVATIGHSLALEIGGFVPWSVVDYTSVDMNQLFDSESFYNVATHNDYPHPPNSNTLRYGYRNLKVTHAPPNKVYQFMVDADLIGSTHFFSVARVLKWSRENLKHFAGGYDAQNMIEHWGYAGAPPVSRIIDGDGTSPGPSHWAMGCHGVANFYVSAFRALNIPVYYLYGHGGSGQGTPVFPTIGHTLGHGDDVYAMRLNIPSMDPDYIPPQDVLISYQTFNDWFFPHGPEAEKNISRRPFDIALEVLPNKILNRYCADLQSSVQESQGSVFDKFSHFYTYTQLVSKNLWMRLEAKRQQFNYCPAS
ncbi:MAG: hypothetical protein ACI8P9_005459 [Parasphingorhabdus sp.]